MLKRVIVEYVVDAETERQAYAMIARFDSDIAYRQVQKWLRDKGKGGCEVYVKDVNITDII